VGHHRRILSRQASKEALGGQSQVCARRQLDAFADQASCNDSDPALAAACRSEGVLAPSGKFAEWFEQALALHDRTPTPFDRSRTELWYGERLRRDRQRMLPANISKAPA
jgi:hypothetical protein